MPNVVVYVPASIWRKLESQHGEGAAAAKVREYARQGWEMLRDGSDSGVAVGDQAGSGSAQRMPREPERAAPDPHFRPDPKPVRK